MAGALGDRCVANLSGFVVCQEELSPEFTFLEVRTVSVLPARVGLEWTSSSELVISGKNS